MKILLLEDDIMLNKSINEYLKALGHSVISCLDGEKALETVINQDFDLLLLDINTPSLNGFEVLEQAQKNQKNIPTLFISALVDIEDISRAYALGCYDYLKKPFHLKELQFKIKKILEFTTTPLEHIRLSKNYSFNLKSWEVFFQRTLKSFSKKHLQIIDILARNRSHIVTYDTFRTIVWNDDFVDDATIRAEIFRLKKILKEDFIKNIRGIGYIIDVPD